MCIRDSNKPVEVGGDKRVLVIRVSSVGVIVSDWLARVLTRNKTMEDSQAVSTIRVTHIVIKATKLFVDRAYVWIG